MPVSLAVKKRIINSAGQKSKCIPKPEPLVDSANRLSSAEIFEKCFQGKQSIVECCCCTLVVKCLLSSELTAEQRDQIYSIAEQNMKDLYVKSSWGWDGQVKRDELFAPEARHLVCFLTHKKSACEKGHHENLPSLPIDENLPCAFVHFRFEVDAQRPIVYCYEIQLREEVRGMRLGQALMEMLFNISTRTQMTRVLLTVFKFNTPAYTFFGKNGFKIDITDPYKHGKFVDYSIMSRKP